MCAHPENSGTCEDGVAPSLPLVDSPPPSHTGLDNARASASGRGRSATSLIFSPASQPANLHMSVHHFHTFSQFATMALATSVATRAHEYSKNSGHGNNIVSEKENNAMIINNKTDRVTIIVGGRTVPQKSHNQHLSQWNLEESSTVSVVINDISAHSSTTTRAGDYNNNTAGTGKHSYYGPYASLVRGDATSTSVIDDDDDHDDETYAARKLERDRNRRKRSTSSSYSLPLQLLLVVVIVVVVGV